MAATDAFFTSPDYFRSVFEQSPVGVFTYDLEARLRDCNDAFIKVLGSTRERLIGLDLRTLRDERIRPVLSGALGGELTTYRGPYDATTGDAHSVIDVRCIPLRDANGVQLGVLAVWVDASESARVERDLREQLALIERQSATIRALGTPILKIWEGVLCLPVIGTVDSARAAEMTDSVLRAIVSGQVRYAIVDLTGVEALDTATAQHLMNLFRSAALLGTEAVVCGIQPTVAQTVVTLGIEMTSVRKTRTLHEALQHCLRSEGTRTPTA